MLFLLLLLLRLRLMEQNAGWVVVGHGLRPLISAWRGLLLRQLFDCFKNMQHQLHASHG